MIMSSLLAFACALTIADDPRPAAEVLRDIQAIVIPEPPESAFPQEIRAYRAERLRLETRKADLVRELHQAHPDHPELVQLLPQRWAILVNQGALKTAEALREADAALAGDEPEALQVEAAYLRASQAAARVRSALDIDRALATIDLFARRAPQDERAADLLEQLAKTSTDLARKVALRERLARDYPDSAAALREVADRRQTEALGQPFALEFDDAITDKHVSMKDLKGKVVVIDFWATWCGPCVADMPKMKKLYAEYKDEGVEFIGVSLDQPEAEGGLSALKRFVAREEVPWPQFFQGNGWESKFSMSWGIKAIPTIFIIDTEGRLHATDARGRLEVLIPLLIEKGKARAARDPG